MSAYAGPGAGNDPLGNAEGRRIACLSRGEGTSGSSADTTRKYGALWRSVKPMVRSLEDQEEGGV